MSSRAERDRVRGSVAPVVDSAGLFLEDVEVRRSASRAVVRVVVDLPEDASGGLDLDALGELSGAVSEALDADDVVRGSYVLEVTSPGADRPLTEPRHFRRARGRLVELHLSDGGTLAGRVRDLDGDVLVLLVEKGPRGRTTSAEQRVELGGVRRGRVLVELSHAGGHEGRDGAPGGRAAAEQEQG